MATKTLYVTKDMKDPIYRNRMLRAGQPLELDGPTQRLYLHLGLVTEQKPKRRAGDDIRADIAELEASGAVPAAPEPKAPRKRRKK